MPPYAGLRIDRDTTLAHSGKACIRFTSSKEGFFQSRAGVCQVLGRGLAGKRMRLSAWVKTDSLKGGQASVRIYANSLSLGMLQSEPSRSFDLTNDWSPVSIEMDVPPDAAEVWAWLAYTVPATGAVYFDDASLEVLGPASATAPARTVAQPASKKPATPAAVKKPAR
jgi:hypothetical protein